MEDITRAEMYSKVMSFIDRCRNIELLKDILVETLDNSTDHRSIEDVYWYRVHDENQSNQK